MPRRLHALVVAYESLTKAEPERGASPRRPSFKFFVCAVDVAISFLAPLIVSFHVVAPGELHEAHLEPSGYRVPISPRNTAAVLRPTKCGLMDEGINVHTMLLAQWIRHLAKCAQNTAI